MAVVVVLNNNNSFTDYILNTRDVSANTSLDNLYSSSFKVTTKFLDNSGIAYQPEATGFYGIPTGALTNNANLQQTVGWGGSFDPLQ
jgi:hypothetical protein